LPQAHHHHYSRRRRHHRHTVTITGHGIYRHTTIMTGPQPS
jgi:hypothetical protein